MKQNETLSTSETAELAGIHRETLLRWLREGRVPEPKRDRNGWRRFSNADVSRIIAYANKEQQIPIKDTESTNMFENAGARLAKLEWDFVDANTGYLTHSIHPYPAKFIPQIPNALIQELSSIGEIVLDPFCGSGTTLVESVRLRRHAIGIDANPLACLLSKAKTTRVEEAEIFPLRQLLDQTVELSQQMSLGTLPLFPDLPVLPFVPTHPPFEGVYDWFDEHVVQELAFLKQKCLELSAENVRSLALTAFSSIIVTVSRQDSDTRYVRREKNIPPGETLRLFSRSLEYVIQRALEFSAEVESKFKASVIEADVLSAPNVGTVDLVVCSPPYPNAYSYHLYHRTRMLWLDMDQPRFKVQEIGSHRKYSHKGQNAATAQTFLNELRSIFRWLNQHLKTNRYACFVIGNSTIRGEVIQNNALLKQAAREAGFVCEVDIERELQSNKKYFNPKIGKIKAEHIVVLRKSRGD